MFHILPPKYLVIGGRGFIGSHLIPRLETYSVIDLKQGFDASKREILNSLQPSPIIFHLGAHLSPADDSDIALHRTVAEFARDTNAHIIYTSSAAVYNPNTLYAVQKLYGEILLDSIPHTFLRLFNVFGAGGHGIVDKIKDGEDFAVNGNGEQRRDYVHVLDVVDALLVAAETKLEGTFDIGTGVSTSVNELLALANIERDYSIGDPGVADSVASLEPLFPWQPQRDVIDYLYAEA